jgi:hypothetical protein
MRRPSEVKSGGVFDRLESVPVRYERVGFEGTRFDGLPAMRRRLSFEACDFVECEFSDCEVDATFCGALAYPESASRFLRTRFVRSRLAGAYLGGATLEQCAFVDCDFEGAIWNSVDLVDCTFEGVVSGLNISASSGPISRPPPFHGEKLPTRHNVITGNDFTRAELRGLGLRNGVPVTQQRWPDRPEYVVLDRLPERVSAALTLLGIPVDAESGVVARLLANEARTGQDTDVYRLDDPAMSQAHHRMVRLLTDVALAAP